MVIANGAQQKIKHATTITKVLVIFASSAETRSVFIDLVQGGPDSVSCVLCFLLMIANCLLCFLVNDNILK